VNARPIANPHLRVSDAERSEVAELLKRHCADGRLDSIEFEGRLDRALRAKTRADLAGLFDDLPGLEPPGPPRRPTRGGPRGPRSTLWLVAAVTVVALLVTSAVSAAWSFARWRVPWVLVIVVALVLWRRCHHHGRGYY
jgi:hypothetical protein